MTFASVRVAVLASILAGLSAPPALAVQPIALGPYPAVLPTLIYDVDYAVSIPIRSTAPGISADTIISIGLPSSVKVSGGCQAQVQWFDWNGAPAGLSGPGVDSVTKNPIILVPGQTLEYTTSTNGNPNNYPNFQENIFRNLANPQRSVNQFEGYAQVRVQCPTSTALKALRVDAEFATQNPSNVAGFPPVIKTKTINVTKPTGLVGY